MRAGVQSEEETSISTNSFQNNHIDILGNKKKPHAGILGVTTLELLTVITGPFFHSNHVDIYQTSAVDDWTRKCHRHTAALFLCFLHFYVHNK